MGFNSISLAGCSYSTWLKKYKFGLPTSSFVFNNFTLPSVMGLPNENKQKGA